jgi:hypothetical protein
MEPKKKRRDGKYTVGCNGNVGGQGSGNLGWTTEGMQRWNKIYVDTAQQRRDDAELGDDSIEKSVKQALLESWSKKSGKPITMATGIRLDTRAGMQQEVGMERAAIVILDDCLSD